MVSKVQTMRKEAGFEVVDHIVIGLKASDEVKKAVQDNAFVKKVTLADAVSDELDGYVKEWDFGGETVTLSVKKVK